MICTWKDVEADRPETHIYSSVQLAQPFAEGKLLSWLALASVSASTCARSSMREDTPSYTRGLHNTAVAYMLCFTA